jgi:hypothetical protein
LVWGRLEEDQREFEIFVMRDGDGDGDGDVDGDFDGDVNGEWRKGSSGRDVTVKNG